MAVIVLTPKMYRPSSPLAGSEADAIFRGKNMALRGTAPQVLYEAYGGSEDLGEPIPAVALTGTISFSPASDIVTGAGTAFLDELHIGQKLLCDAEVLSVAEIISQTSFRNGRPILSTEAGTAAQRLPRIFPLDVNRGSLLWGNGVYFDRGTICAVGDGALYKNGAVLPGASLTAERTPQYAIYDSTTGNYTVVPLGFDVTPIAPSVAMSAAGGSKNMSLGYYSFHVGYYSDVTTGYSDGGNVILAAANAPFQLTVANSLWEFDFTSDNANRAAQTQATGYVIYQSSFGGSSAISQVNAIQGGWFEAKRFPFTDLDVNDKYTYEAVDNDLTTLLSFDNDAPSDAEFITTLDNYTCLLSTNGQGVNTGSRTTTTSPGAFISPQKSGNNDGFPASLKVPTEKGEIILGFVSAAGRFFVMTPNTLQAVSSTGLPSAPMSSRPFWRRGFVSPDNCAFFDDTLYGFSGNSAYRSIATGDSASASNDFATDVETAFDSWFGAYEFTTGDSTAEQVLYIQTATRQNADGYWESDILPFSLQHRCWLPPVVLSDSTRDMIISGATEINNQCVFIAGGRRAGDTNQFDTWRYNTGSSQETDCYLAFQYTDNGAELLPKILQKLRSKGKFDNGATVQVYITTANEEINVADLEAGINPTFAYNLAASTEVTQYQIKKTHIKNALMWTIRIGFTANWSGSGLKDQFHEIAVMLDVSGQER